MNEGQRESEWFGARLRELRESKGWTQQQLADNAGLTRDGIAQIERGRRKPIWETVLALARALGVTCEAFTEPPETTDKPKPGRPKSTEEPQEGTTRKRGRPKKDETANEPNAGEEATEKPKRNRRKSE